MAAVVAETGYSVMCFLQLISCPKQSNLTWQIAMLESNNDLFHYLQVSQVTRELGGTLSYNHDQWIEIRRVSLMVYVADQGRLTVI